MKRIFGIAMLATMAVASQAITIAQFNFNSVPNDATTGTGTTAANVDLVVGVPTASLVGGVTSTFNAGGTTGIAPASSSDPAFGSGDNSGWNTTAYAAQSTGDRSRGTAYAVNTTGYKDIRLSFDQRTSNTGSRFTALQYTLNGSTWADATVFEATIGGDSWYNRSFDFTSIVAANNNANFAVRMVSAFKPTTSTYFSATANTSVAYAVAGTQRFDMVSFNANAVPEPASMLAIGLGIAGVVTRRRRSR